MSVGLPGNPFGHDSFAYRSDGSTFLLYSVGRDGADEGGRFANRSTYYATNGYDLDLDTFTRQ